MINITIDGKQLEVPEGTTVLRAAEMAGVSIPTLCDHHELTPYGGCRLCLVEVDGFRTLQPSCTLPVNKGMVIRTDTPQIRTAREFILTMIFSERNHYCMYCQVSGGDCELQNAAYGEGMTHWPLVPNFQNFTVDASNPFFVLENNRCILCRRCVRACGELVGNFTLGIEERGTRSILVADAGVPIGESTCVSCGTCVQICPTGALIDRVSAYRGRETQVEHHKTICTECSVGCGVDVLTRDNILVRIEGDWDAPVNSGLLCKQGRFLPLEEKRERISTPLVRRNGALKAATWDEALETIAGKVKGSEVAALASTRLPAEALVEFEHLFASRLGSQMVTSLEEGRFTSASSKAVDTLGGPFEGTLAALQKADAVLAFGVDLTADHEVAGFFVKRTLPVGTRLLIVDSETNNLEWLAEVTLKPAKGASLEAAKALLAAVKAEPTSGLDAAGLAKAAMILKHSENAVIVYGKTAQTVETVAALAALAKETGASLISLKGEANSLAAAQLHLDKPFKLNGHQAAFVALGDEEPTAALVKNLTGVPFLAVQASYVSPLTAQADVVLPVTMWAEQAGHYLNLEGRLQAASASLTAPEGVRSNLDAIIALEKCLNESEVGD